MSKATLPRSLAPLYWGLLFSTILIAVLVGHFAQRAVSTIRNANAQLSIAILGDTPSIKLLFTDVVMPEMNGKKLADEALKKRPDLKVLFTIGYTRNAVVHGGVLDPDVNFISKPFTIEQLAGKVRAVLDA